MGRPFQNAKCYHIFNSPRRMEMERKRFWSIRKRWNGKRLPLPGIHIKYLYKNEQSGASMALCRFEKGAGIPEAHSMLPTSSCTS